MTDFDVKVLDNFPGKVVRKDLTTLMKKGANVPTYVLEYLLGMYCAKGAKFCCEGQIQFDSSGGSQMVTDEKEVQHWLQQIKKKVEII